MSPGDLENETPAVAAAARAARVSAEQSMAGPAPPVEDDTPFALKGYSVSFARGTAWMPKYQRNNKSKGAKNLRCFPHCAKIGHQQSFCGRSIKVIFQYSKGTIQNNNNELLAVAEFALENFSTRPAGIKLSLKDINQHGEEASNPLSHIEGIQVRGPEIEQYNQSDNHGAIMFEFNKTLKGWHYGFLGSKKTRDWFHNFRVYVLQKTNEKNSKDEVLYKILGSCISPQFQMYCRRRIGMKNHMKLYRDLYAEEVKKMSEDKNNDTSCFNQKQKQIEEIYDNKYLKNKENISAYVQSQMGQHIKNDIHEVGQQIKNEYYNSLPPRAPYGSNGENNKTSYPAAVVDPNNNIPVVFNRRSYSEPELPTNVNQYNKTKKFGQKRNSEEISSNICNNSAPQTSRRRADSDYQQGNSSRVLSLAQNNSNNFQLQQHQGIYNNNHATSLMQMDHRWEMASSLLDQMGCPFPLRAHKFNEQQICEISGIAQTIHMFFLHMDQMHGINVHVPAHIDVYARANNPKTVAQMDNFLYFICNSPNFMEKIKSFLHNTSIEKNQVNIVRFGSTSFTEVLNEFLRSSSINTNNNTSPKGLKSNNTNTVRCNKFVFPSALNTDQNDRLQAVGALFSPRSPSGLSTFSRLNSFCLTSPRNPSDLNVTDNFEDIDLSALGSIVSSPVSIKNNPQTENSTPKAVDIMSNKIIENNRSKEVVANTFNKKSSNLSVAVPPPKPMVNKQSPPTLSLSSLGLFSPRNVGALGLSPKNSFYNLSNAIGKSPKADSSFNNQKRLEYLSPYSPNGGSAFYNFVQTTPKFSDLKELSEFLTETHPIANLHNNNISS